MTTTLIVIAIIAWCIQIIFSWLQIHRFNRAFLAMKQGTYLGIGRNKTMRFKPRVLIAISLDEHQVVVDSVLMKGITVFSLPKPITQLHGLSVADIIPNNIFPNDSACQNALVVALSLKNNN
ncbi:transcriptional regulator GutM [Gilliamella sp. Pra-s65]|uniref:transcriptional regulator GutM n=1 Tax=unclassified Gilliamella TaxID=2685620 RepID=UPI001365A10E|nr:MULTISPECIES: transcriptional regulator GutM [unclassified Gilliamella]MWN90771.1 transcriptional regulator GutM [Gilliamella sp. Pra-s65]MWP46815.1 transcriptional regulator GutM [Gilliamella sp. Pas-s27]MWP72092.1 transcriptional regulator GutM [Gilliamella sp. Pra-s52]